MSSHQEAVSGAAAPSTSGTYPQQQSSTTLFTRPKLYEIVNNVACGERLEPSVEYALLKIAEAFVMEVSTSAAELARHRHSHALQPKDVQLYLEREWDMGIAGFVEEEDKMGVKINHPTVAHQTRSAHANRASGNPTSQHR